MGESVVALSHRAYAFSGMREFLAMPLRAPPLLQTFRLCIIGIYLQNAPADRGEGHTCIGKADEDSVHVQMIPDSHWLGSRHYF